MRLLSTLSSQLQLTRDAQGGWLPHALNAACPDTATSELEIIKGVVTRKKRLGDRKLVK